MWKGAGEVFHGLVVDILSYFHSEAAFSTAMYHLLQLTVLSLLCLHTPGWVIKRSTQNKPWKALDQLQNRELFLTALQSYFSNKGIHVDRTAPAFILPLSEHDTRVRGTQEEQAPVTLEPSGYA
ncbi:UNVERIFIED_CONTAM: hypothetical protein K2H54_018731 [Gekko kuhli]